MSTEHFRNDDGQASMAATAIAAAHAANVLEQAAQHAAAMAIARWSTPSGQPVGLPARAGWYDDAQRKLHAWLAAGGFRGDSGAVGNAPREDLGASLAGTGDNDVPLPFPGSRPRFYNLFRTVRSVTD